jgi:hypothetical protein
MVLEGTAAPTLHLTKGAAMNYQLSIRVEAYHKPTQVWHCRPISTYGLRAVSRKHAIEKALRHAVSLPCYADRADHPDWQVSVEVSIIEAS